MRTIGLFFVRGKKIACTKIKFRAINSNCRAISEIKIISYCSCMIRFNALAFLFLLPLTSTKIIYISCFSTDHFRKLTIIDHKYKIPSNPRLYELFTIVQIIYDSTNYLQQYKLSTIVQIIYESTRNLADFNVGIVHVQIICNCTNNLQLY